MEEPTDLKLIGLIGGVWAVPQPDQQPVIWLESWKVFELDNGDHHLVGWHGAAREGRVSSRVEAFDGTRRQALTQSGRVYELAGREGCNADALFVWSRWLEANEHPRATDVTTNFVRRIEEGRH